MPGTVYTVASGKGGVGKTTTSVNLAVALWREGNAVALVDADIGMANLAAVLDLEPEETLHDVLAGRATVEEAVIEAKDGDLMVLPGDRSLDSFADADPAALRAVVSDLAGRADYVIVDTGAGLSYEDVLPLGMADGVVLVTTPDPAAFGDTMKTMEIAELLDAPIRGLVITRAVEDTNTEAIAAEIGAELLGAIPEDPAVMASTVAGDPLESHAPDAEAAAAYRDLATAVIEGDEEWLAEHAREPVDEGHVAAADGPTVDPGERGGESATNPAPDASDVDEEAPDGDQLSEGADESPADEDASRPGPTDADAAEDDGPSADTGADTSPGSASESAPDPDPEAEEPADDEPRTFPAGGVPREGRATEGTGGEGDEAEEAGEEEAPDDEVGGDEGNGDGTEEAVEGEAEARDEAADDEDAETEEKRGGFLGWLGRLFS